jgi:hypothetical protein
MKNFEFEVVGFSSDGSEVIFKLGEKKYYLKSTLKKSDLVSYLNIPPEFINTQLRNDILNQAMKKGRLKACYSPDGLQWFQEYYIPIPKECERMIKSNKIVGKYKKLIRIEDWEKLPDCISELSLLNLEI